MVIPVWMPMGPSRLRLQAQAQAQAQAQGQSPSQGRLPLLQLLADQRPSQVGPQIVVLVARSNDDGRSLIAAVRRGATVLLDTRGLSPERGQRLVDYCTGGVLAMDGQAHRAGDNAFLFAPALARVTAA